MREEPSERLATSEQGDRREVQPGVIVRRRRQSTEDVAAEGEETPRAERRLA
ncbi:MAG: hypothetical protein ACLSHC_07640 [Bilophila wadsworthia]